MPRFRLPEILTGALVAGIALSSAPAAEIPDLMGTNATAWFVFNDEFQPPPSGPGPVTFDKRYPYVDNREARQRGIQPTYRIADLDNPILQPWAREEMRKANEQVHAGKVPFRSRERCYPGGRSWLRRLHACRAVLFRADRETSDDRRPGRPGGAPHLSRCPALGEGDAELVRRIDRPLRGRGHPRRRYHRHLDPILRRQLPHAAYRQAARGGAFQADRE